MPELPEVETTRAGLAPAFENHKITSITIHNGSLRWPVDPQLPSLLKNRKVLGLTRRAKYLIFTFSHGHIIAHLGMSGSMRICPSTEPRKKHDHIEITTSANKLIRFNDPRRFGAFIWTPEPIEHHALIKSLGPEPLSEGFDADHLWRASRNKKQCIKTFIMDGHVVVGVGNIYASEALYLAGISPKRAAGSLSKARIETLSHAIKSVLGNAIKQGGTTLRDFVNGEGKPGYFQQQLAVYNRVGETCKTDGCDSKIKMIRLGQRSTFYCPRCQR